MKYSKISIHISTNAVNLSKEALALDVTMIKKRVGAKFICKIL